MSNHNEGIRYAGEVEVISIEIYSYKKEKIDISSQMIEMSIYEDIFSNTIHGTILISDSFDLIHNLPLIGEELINIKLRTPTMGNVGTIDYYGYVYKVSDRQYTSERGQIYLIHFASYETIIDLNKKVSKSFSGNITDLVKTIVKDEKFLGSEKELITEPTANSIKFVAPFWNPLKTVNWLSVRALKESNKSPTFLLYETLDNKLKFLSLDTLYNQSPKQGVNYRYDHYLRDKTNDGSVRNIEMEYNMIRDVYVEEVFDYMKRIDSGVYSSRVINANLVSKTIKTNVTDYLVDFPKTSHMANFPASSNNLIRRNGAAIFNVSNSEFVYNGQRSFRVEEWFAQRKSLMGQALNVFKIDMVVSGRLDVHAGDCVNIELSQLQPLNRGESKDQSVNNYFKGKFLVGAIHHRFEGNNHTMIMQCFTESLSKELK